MRNFGTGSLSETGEKVISPAISRFTWMELRFNMEGSFEELRWNPTSSFQCLKKGAVLRMDEAMKCIGALFWKDIWRRSKSDSAIVIVRYNSVLFVVYLSLLHIDRLSRKAFASTGSSIFCYTSGPYMSNVFSPSRFKEILWSHNMRLYSSVWKLQGSQRGACGPILKGSWSRFHCVHMTQILHFTCYPFCEIHADFPQLLSSSLGI